MTKEYKEIVNAAVEIYLNENVKYYKAIQKAVITIKGGANET